MDNGLFIKLLYFSFSSPKCIRMKVDPLRESQVKHKIDIRSSRDDIDEPVLG